MKWMTGFPGGRGIEISRAGDKGMREECHGSRHAAAAACGSGVWGGSRHRVGGSSGVFFIHGSVEPVALTLPVPPLSSSLSLRLFSSSLSLSLSRSSSVSCLEDRWVGLAYIHIELSHSHSATRPATLFVRSGGRPFTRKYSPWPPPTRVCPLMLLLHEPYPELTLYRRAHPLQPLDPSFVDSSYPPPTPTLSSASFSPCLTVFPTIPVCSHEQVTINFFPSSRVIITELQLLATTSRYGDSKRGRNFVCVKVSGQSTIYFRLF